ncbi:DUF4118 domain-containing protein [Sulfoacidibacillus thermotolerans]|uniref:histidine kinase n=1 Tax=Sulfoacidibacillus thermotolerans TaxID=1765684 RepID=A0A2U3D8F5_SULT2|nr:DUF4118 domain-containing protein [Sulfoacidibacillus thermotolerans]PWI57551.1 hypothetical protein BM613_07980 [Sulfoacidibacillus thermotolerans]
MEVRRKKSERLNQGVWPYLLVTVAIGLLTLALLKVGLSFQLANIALLFLLPVLFSATRWGVGPSIYAAAVGVVAFDYFFVPPIFSFSVSDLRYLISFAVFLVVAILTATLAFRLRQQVYESQQREADTASLYQLSKRMTALDDLDDMATAIVSHVADTFHAPVWIVLPKGDAYGCVKKDFMEPLHDVGVERCALAESDLCVDACLYVLQNGKSAGLGTENFSREAARYFLLKTEEVVRGVLVIGATSDLHEGIGVRQHLVEAFVGLATVSVARIQLEREARIARLSAESERLRTALLDSISHELRTPLAGIIGSVTGMIEHAEVLSPEDQRDLLFTIRDSAMRMNRLVTNLLGMVRLESGMLTLRRRLCDVADMLGVVLRQLQDPLLRRKVQIQMPAELPPFYVDDVLIEQVLVNILSNAVKYSFDGSQIDIQVREQDGVAVIIVEDEGIGIPEGEEEKIFDKFYRAESAKRIPGTGLGLAICKGIVEAHGGQIFARRKVPTGIRMVIQLPIAESQEESGDGRKNLSD